MCKATNWKFRPMLQTIIEKKLQHALSPEVVTVVNESHQHNVPTDAQSHFRLLIVSEQFTNMTRVQRQRRVYQILADEMAAGVHALTMQTLTPSEWQTDTHMATSPPCLGGN